MSINAPPGPVWRVGGWAINTFIDELRRVRLRHPVTVTSWYRDPVANRLAGGNRASQHLLGTALDLVPADQWGSMQQIHDDVEASTRLIAVDRGDHVHLQLFPMGLFGSWLDRNATPEQRSLFLV